MKKIIKTIIIISCTTIFVIGCNKNNEYINKSNENNIENLDLEVIKVTEVAYMDYIYDIYLDEDKYLGNMIEIEAIFTKDNNENLYVYRLTDSTHEHDDEIHTEEVIIIESDSVEIMKERGTEKVS